MKKITTVILLIGVCASVFAGCNTPSATPTQAPTAQAPDKVTLSSGAVVGSYPQSAQLNRAELDEVRISEGVWAEKMQANSDYIESLDPYRILYFYYKNAGVENPSAEARPYDGCELTNDWGWHGGMFLGHYVSALSMNYAVTGEAKWKEKSDLVVAELAKCQMENGYLFSKPEKLFDRLEKAQGEHGVLYYYIHKVLAGLIDAYKYCDNAQALEIAKKMSDWVVSRMSKLTSMQINVVLGTEYGGMNEALYNLYAITGRESDLQAAQYFNEAKWLGAWYQNRDNLNMVHGNTTVPKAVGFIRGAMVSEDADNLRTAAQNFFNMIVDGRIFSTGAFSEREIMGQFGKISNQIHNCPGETCKSYNMLKLAMYLYEDSGNAKYMEYAERVLFNALMGSTDEDGCKTYYQWLDTDALKLFHSETGSFWCCTGTGVETFSKVPEAAWIKVGDNGIRLTMFISGSYDDGTMALKLVNDDEKNVITVERDFNGYIQLRVPSWADGVTLSVKGETVDTIAQVDGIISIQADWKKGDTIEYVTKYKLIAEPTFDDPTLISLRMGPYVMAAIGEQYEIGNLIANGDWLNNAIDKVTKNDDGTYTIETPNGARVFQKYGEITTGLYTVYLRTTDKEAIDAIKPDIAMRASVTTSMMMPYLPDQKQVDQTGHYYGPSTGKADYTFPIHDGKVPDYTNGLINNAGYSMYDATVKNYEAFVPFTRGEHYVGYIFDKEYAINGISVYFGQNSDNAINTNLPSKWYVEYYDGTEWKKVTNASGFTLQAGWNNVTFDTVTTSKLRLYVKTTRTVGVYEWTVNQAEG